MSIKFVLLFQFFLISSCLIHQLSAMFDEEFYGSPCTSKSDCMPGQSYSYDSFSSIQCKNNKCDCSYIMPLMKYGETLKTKCTFEIKFTGPNKKCLECHKNITCDMPCMEHATCVEKDLCQCNEGYLFVEKRCVKADKQNVGEQCSIQDDVAHYCDYNDLMHCSYGKCKCFKNYYPHKGGCISKSEYIQEHNMTEYKVKPGEYCYSDNDCVEGLECRRNNNECQCRSNCEYKPQEEICDCGIIPTEPATLPAIVGCFLGLISVIFWVVCIKKTKKDLLAKRERDTNITLQSTTGPLPYSTVPNEPDSGPPTISTATPSHNEQQPYSEPPPPYSSVTGDNYYNKSDSIPPSYQESEYPTKNDPISVPPAINPYNYTPDNSYPLNPNLTNNYSAPYPISPNPVPLSNDPFAPPSAPALPHLTSTNTNSASESLLPRPYSNSDSSNQPLPYGLSPDANRQ